MLDEEIVIFRRVGREIFRPARAARAGRSLAPRRNCRARPSGARRAKRASSASRRAGGVRRSRAAISAMRSSSWRRSRARRSAASPPRCTAQSSRPTSRAYGSDEQKGTLPAEDGVGRMRRRHRHDRARRGIRPPGRPDDREASTATTMSSTARRPSSATASLPTSLIVVAKTDPSKGAKGTSLLVVETADAKGFRRGRNLDKVGMEAQDTSELFFDDVRVPTANLIGPRGGDGLCPAHAAIAAGTPDDRDRRRRALMERALER